MGRPALLAIVLGAAAATGCAELRERGSGLLGALGRASFVEVDARRAGRALDAGALLLQAQGDARPSQLAPGARRIAPDQPLDEVVLGHRILVVAEEPELALQLAARLARAGAARVSVVEGGLPAWMSERMEE